MDVSEAELAIVKSILARHVPGAAVWAFGSRATGKAKKFSDLDLCIDTGKPLGLNLASALAEDFAESDLPWKVDLVDWATTSEGFRKIIERDRIDL
ncbi:MAG: Nucleotidyltransferase domain protein [Fluviibacter phosphoraccumulans EoVTN8]